MECNTLKEEVMLPDYNTTRKKLILPEYGRHIQSMVDSLLTIEDRDERTRAAKTVINVMGNLSPHLRDVPDFRHKLWDHLAIMSNFQLDIDWPYPLPSAEKLHERPEKLEYNNQHPIRYKHYGLMSQKLIAKIKEMEDPTAKRILTVLTANHMKKSFLNWNKPSVEDAQILDDLNTLHGSRIEWPEGISLSSSKELLQAKINPNTPKNKNNGNNNNNNNPKGGNNGNGKKKKRKK